ncbi:zinc transporter ZIP12-like [Diadema antillarum]|uniref:zinc transporter ZIP12-like n=1 Tax=Diadema antillarum TaxID=105358 RepID=UPI003A8A5CFB
MGRGMQLICFVSPMVRVRVFSCLRTLSYFVFVWSALFQSAAGQIHGRNGPFERVARLLQQKQETKLGARLDLAQTQLLIDTLLQRVDCYRSNKPEVCDWCLPAETLFRIIGIDVADGSLDDAAFGKASVVLIYYLHAPQDACTMGPSTAGTNDSFTYRDYLVALSGLNSSTEVPPLGEQLTYGEDTIFSEEKLDLLIESVNRSYIPTSRFQCFDAHTLIAAADVRNADDISQSELETLGAHFISSVLHGHCIGEGVLVPPSYFAQYIFSEFGSDHIISEAGFQRLLGSINLGTVQTEQTSDTTVIVHDHGTHDHDHETGKEHVATPSSPGHDAGKDQHGHDHHGHDHHGHDHHGHDHSGHAHRRKRAPAVEAHHGHENESLQQCYSAEQLMDIFGVNHALGISESQFQELCPAILHQVITDACNPHAHGDEIGPTSPLTKLEVYGWGTLSVFIVTLTSIFAILLFPFMGPQLKEYVMQTFIALSVSTMSGDALLHLVPEALGLHNHAEELAHAHDHGGHESAEELENQNMDTLYKMSTVVGAIYFLFLFETAMNALFRRKASTAGEERKRCSRLVENDDKTSMFNMQADQAWLTETATVENNLPNLPDLSSLTHPNVNGNNDTEDRGVEQLVTMEYDEGNSSSCLVRGLTPISIMILLGDALHNVLDGVVIGAAFTSDIFFGVSTSIAVLCHEIPHELGDFGVLIGNGMCYGAAVFWNFASGCSAFIGLYVGILIGTQEGAQKWLFAVTAGFFLYVSMVDLFGGMLKKDVVGHPHSHGPSSPAMKRSPAMSNRHSWLQEMAINEKSEKREKIITFFCQNIGLLVGWAIMFLLAFYEEELLYLKFVRH